MDLFKLVFLLIFLHLGCCNILDEIPKETTDINLSNMGLLSEDLEKADFSVYLNLTSLDLSNNKIQKIPSSIFKNNVLLEKLDLSQNKELFLPMYESFLEVDSVKFLNLSGCGLAFLPANTFDEMPNLFSLDLSNNDIDILKDFEALSMMRMPLQKIIVTDIPTEQRKAICNELDLTFVIVKQGKITPCEEIRRKREEESEEVTERVEEDTTIMDEDDKDHTTESTHLQRRRKKQQPNKPQLMNFEKEKIPMDEKKMPKTFEEDQIIVDEDPGITNVDEAELLENIDEKPGSSHAGSADEGNVNMDDIPEESESIVDKRDGEHAGSDDEDKFEVESEVGQVQMEKNSDHSGPQRSMQVRNEKLMVEGEQLGSDENRTEQIGSDISNGDQSQKKPIPIEADNQSNVVGNQTNDLEVKHEDEDREANGESPLESGQEKNESSQEKIESGQQKIESSPEKIESGQGKAENDHEQTNDNQEKTEDIAEKAEESQEKTKDNHEKSKDEEHTNANEDQSKSGTNGGNTQEASTDQMKIDENEVKTGERMSENEGSVDSKPSNEMIPKNRVAVIPERTNKLDDQEDDYKDHEEKLKAVEVPEVKDGEQREVTDETETGSTTTVIIYLFVGVVAIGGAAFGYSYYRKRKNAYNSVNKEEPGRELQEIRRTKALANNRNDDNNVKIPIPEGKPLMYGEANVKDEDTTKNTNENKEANGNADLESGLK